MEYKEFSAKTVDDAITDATIEFGVTSDNLEYEVVTEGSAGLFGIFAKQAVIKARIKEAKSEEPERRPAKARRDDENKKSRAEASAKKDAPAKKQTSEKNAPVSKSEAPVKREPENEITAAVKTGSDGESSAQDKKTREGRARNNTDSEEVRAIIEKFLTDVLDKMEMPAQVRVEINDETRDIDIEIEGGTGDIIGKRGQTLDALQYLASIVANREKEEYYRVKLDTKNYRERRAKTLENLAKNVAAKVKKTKRKVVLEPMNPYERRIIHAYLQSDKQVTTKSEGEEPNRRVVVYYKR